MAENPYKAPAAIVADPAAPQEYIPPPPQGIRIALGLLWTAFFVGIASLAPGVRKDMWAEADGVSPTLLVFVAALFSGLFAFLVASVGRRRNWARWVLLTYLVAGWLVLALDPSTALSQGRVAVVADALITLAEIYACFLLFFGPGAQWFKAVSLYPESVRSNSSSSRREEA